MKYLQADGVDKGKYTDLERREIYGSIQDGEAGGETRQREKDSAKLIN